MQAAPLLPHPIPDPYLEFGVDRRLVGFLPDDYFPHIADLVQTVEALYGEELDSKQHHSLHHTALRGLLVCYYHILNFGNWLFENVDDNARQAINAQVTDTVDKEIKQELWFHLLDLWQPVCYRLHCLLWNMDKNTAAVPSTECSHSVNAAESL